MYRPLPDGLTIKNSPIEGLGLFTNISIKKNTFIGVTHIRDEQFDNKYIRTPLGGFYNHSNDPTVMRMVSDTLPRLKFGDEIDPKMAGKKIKDGKTDREKCIITYKIKRCKIYVYRNRKRCQSRR